MISPNETVAPQANAVKHVHLPPAIETAIAVLRLRLLDFVFPNLEQHLERMHELRRQAPNDAFFVGFDKVSGDRLIPVLTVPVQDEKGGVSETCPFRVLLKRDFALAFVNLIAHLLFAEGIEVCVGLVNEEGRGYVYRVIGLDDNGLADVRGNELLGRISGTSN